MFGRATIRLGIGPHFSWFCFENVMLMLCAIDYPGYSSDTCLKCITRSYRTVSAVLVAMVADAASASGSDGGV